MDFDAGWTSVEVPEMEALPRPVTLRSQSLPARHIFPFHCHRWNQFVYATSGTLVVTVEDSWHVITPEQAIWVPTGLLHTTGALHGADFRNLYVADLPGLGMPSRCTALAVTPLLRALILELVDISRRGGEDEAYIGQVNGLILAQLPRLAVIDFHLPWPRSVMLRKVCETLYGSPADPRGAEEWGAELGASGRTLARRFEKETGLGLREWRQRLRLFRAIEWLGGGRSITDIALELGYASPSAFAYMFRHETGFTPTEWRAR